MDGIRLISYSVIIFLLFRVSIGTNQNLIDALSSIIPAFVGNNSASMMKSNKFRCQNYDVISDAGNIHEEKDGTRSRIKRTVIITECEAERSGREPKIWDRWGNWSTCSVTCGIGKIVRWRHCISGSCSLGEKKAQLKTCTSAAC